LNPLTVRSFPGRLERRRKTGPTILPKFFLSRLFQHRIDFFNAVAERAELFEEFGHLQIQLENLLEDEKEVI
jgi:hypothetical protein